MEMIKIPIMIAIFIFILVLIQQPFMEEYTIIEFNEKKKISEKDYNTLCDILNSKYEMENIEIHKIATNFEIREDGIYYIFFKADNFKYKASKNDTIYNIYDDDGNITERVLYHINMFENKEYVEVRNICNKYHRFWEKNEKQLRVEITNNEILNEQ